MTETEIERIGRERDEARAELKALKTNHLNDCDGFNCAYCNWMRAATENARLRPALQALTAAVVDAMETPSEAASWSESGDMQEYIFFFLDIARRALEGSDE